MSAVGGHHPELMPRAPQIGGVHHALAIGRKSRPRLPVRFLVMDLARLGPWRCLHPPKPARAVNMPAIGDEQNLRAVPCPYRTDLMIRLAVVIAGQVTYMLSSKLPYVAE